MLKPSNKLKKQQDEERRFLLEIVNCLNSALKQSIFELDGMGVRSVLRRQSLRRTRELDSPKSYQEVESQIPKILRLHTAHGKHMFDPDPKEFQQFTKVEVLKSEFLSKRKNRLLLKCYLKDIRLEKFQTIKSLQLLFTKYEEIQELMRLQLMNGDKHNY